MARIVMKFGGTSVADIARIRNVARHVKREVDAGHEVAVVVSAMAGKTNELVGWTREASPMHDAREYDAVVASGEQVTAGLLAIALQIMGVHARSWQGWQIPIQHRQRAWRGAHLEIDGAFLIKRFGEGQVAVVAGFQGIGPDNRIATLGRGGSDTSAVAHRRGGQGRPLRHLHRCRRGLHHRSAHRAEGAAAGQDLVRGNARNGLARRQGAAGALGRACHGAQGAYLRALVLRRSRCARHGRSAQSARNADLRRGRNRGTAGRHRNCLCQGRSPDLAAPSSATGRALPPASSGRWPRPTSMST